MFYCKISSYVYKSTKKTKQNTEAWNIKYKFLFARKNYQNCLFGDIYQRANYMYEKGLQFVIITLIKKGSNVIFWLLSRQKWNPTKNSKITTKSTMQKGS